jgi:hypothetical protein
MTYTTLFCRQRTVRRSVAVLETERAFPATSLLPGETSLERIKPLMDYRDFFDEFDIDSESKFS